VSDYEIVGCDLGDRGGVVAFARAWLTSSIVTRPRRRPSGSRTGETVVAAAVGEGDDLGESLGRAETVASWVGHGVQRR